MKKLLAVLLALVAVAGFAFAEDPAPALTFGAYGDITATVYDQDGYSGYALYTETYFNYTAKDMGFSATTVGSNDMFAAFRNYSFWYTLNDGMFKILAGQLRETGGARLTSYIDGNGFSTRLANVATGIMVTAKPVSGLVISAFMPFAAGTTVAYQSGNASFGAGYLIPNVANVVAAYRLSNSELSIGADIKAIKDVTLKIGYKMVDPTNYIYLTAGTTLDKLTLGLDSNFVLATAFDFGAKVKVEYALSDMVSLGLKATYDTGADAWYAADGFTANPYAQINFAAGDIIVGFSFDSATSAWSLPIDFELSF